MYFGTTNSMQCIFEQKVVGRKTPVGFPTSVISDNVFDVTKSRFAWRNAIESYSPPGMMSFKPVPVPFVISIRFSKSLLSVSSISPPIRIILSIVFVLISLISFVFKQAIPNTCLITKMFVYKDKLKEQNTQWPKMETRGKSAKERHRLNLKDSQRDHSPQLKLKLVLTSPKQNTYVK